MLTSLAINSFASYAKRARAADALEQLDLYHMRMEKAFLDNGNYGVGSCAVSLPTTVVSSSPTPARWRRTRNRTPPRPPVRSA